jgi:predicted dehydrogenase
VVRVGVVGCGYWGPKLARNFSEIPGSDVTAVCDRNAERLGRGLPHLASGVRAMADADELIALPCVDAVVIATPASTHFELAMKALRAGRHVLVEKPLALSSVLAEQLIEEAARRNLVLMVDHTFVYTGAVRTMRQILDEGGVGDLLYFDSVRINLGSFRHDVNVLWDLAAHDLSIMEFLLGRHPCAVSATGASHVIGTSEDVGYLTLFFEDALIAHVHANWLAPVKMRRTLIGGSRQMIVYDDLEPTEKVKVYDRGILLRDGPGGAGDLRIDYRTGEMRAPLVDTTEALRTASLHFVQCIARGERPVTDGEAGMRVIQILEAATSSLAERGRPVEVVSAAKQRGQGAAELLPGVLSRERPSLLHQHSPVGRERSLDDLRQLRQVAERRDEP